MGATRISQPFLFLFLPLFLFSFFGFTCFFIPLSHAESTLSSTWDLSTGLLKGNNTLTLSWSEHYGFGSSGRFKVGFGLRFSSFFGGDNLDYTTADSDLSKANKVNTLTLSGAQTNSINTALWISYLVSPRVGIGLNLDLFGLGSTNQRTGVYESSNSTYAGLQTATGRAFNVQLFGARSRGQLNSELYVSYWLSPSWATRAGFSYLISEYATDLTLDYGNQRFRYSTLLLFLAFTFRPK